jgi:hypothetical protein
MPFSLAFEISDALILAGYFIVLRQLQPKGKVAVRFPIGFVSM